MAIQPFPQQRVVGAPQNALPGMTRGAPDPVAEGRVAESALKPGVFVVRGTDPGKEVDLPSDSDTHFYGVTIRSQVNISAETPVGGQVDVLQAGQVAVEVEDAVTAGGLVYVRTTAGVGEELGAVRSDADGGDAVATPWVFTHSGAAGSIVWISSVGGEAQFALAAAAAAAAE